MPDENVPTPEPPPEQSTLLGSVPPDEMLARGMQSVKMTNGAEGTWQAPATEEAAGLFPGYEVLRLLGRGGMGAVYQARQIELDRLVAIKLLPLEISVDKDFADRFRREARAMAKLNHPNIITVHDFGKTNEGHLYFAMEFVEGSNLADIIHQVGLDPDQALSIAEQVCHALSYAHDKGIVHRDIKPANVMINTESHVKVADFGLARLLDAKASDLGHTMTGTVMGTPDYMAPEQMQGMDVDHRADIYSVGVMIYEMLCRQVPRGVFQPPSLRTGCDPRIDELVLKAMQQAPEHRYQSTREMKGEVTATRLALAEPAPQVLALRPTRAPQVSARPIVLQKVAWSAPAKSKLPLYAILTVVVLALAAGAFFFFKPKEAKLTLAQIYAREHPGQTVQDDGPSVGQAPRLPDGGSPPPPASGALALQSFLAEATKDKPFVNSLGLKFVPVPIVSGPTAGQRVLFGVWDVRVQDYAVYAAAHPKVDGGWKMKQKDGVPAGRELDHPVVGVTWEDAQAFCQWLTEKEQAEGRLPKGLKYRLPSDEEWSWAVGLPPEVGTTPAEKSGKNSVDFPWGKDYPPKGKLDNYADETFHAKFPLDENAKNDWSKNHWIEGYTDGYATTSPVGSFPANAYGLYDMGGNVWQWCEDWFDKDHKDRVLRGAAWDENVRGLLLSSTRSRHVPAFRTFNIGIRCVVGASDLPATGPAESRREALPALPTKQDATSADVLSKASRAVPFENTLGMKFVPVPIASGPTAGQRVLFGVWDVRVQDYAVYAAANPKAGFGWKMQQKEGVPAGRELDHPVIAVSWEDAQAFCQWLTAKEIAEGKLPKGLKYRLPSDEEWSWAVGLPPELGTTPAEKAEKNSVDFPWGKDYPPTRKVGNYADEAFHEKFPATKIPWIEGYNDGYGSTSPVGSFPANAYGLYDMGGNVWQWCEDWFAASHEERVLRGASWADRERRLLSSNRLKSVPACRYYTYGFRCVLSMSDLPAPGPASLRAAAAAALEPNAIRLWDAATKVPTTPTSRWEEDAVRLDTGMLRLETLPSRDAIIRAKIRMNPEARTPEVCLRLSPTKKFTFYRLGVLPDKNRVSLEVSVEGKGTQLKQWPLPRAYAPEEWLTLELRAVGDQLTATLDGTVLGVVHDSTITEAGGVMIYGGSASYFRDVVYVPLDQPGSRANSPTTATRDVPFENTLGMKFVPVPIASGPTAGQQVLFGVWDVRMQDYGVYAAANPKVDGSWKTQQKDGVPVGRELNHPVVSVSWEEAQAFCQWLTEKEQAEGKLPKGLKYRLPSDEEWSWAVGLPLESGKMPSEKIGKNVVDFPWGKEYPPTTKVGNYADEAYHAKFPLVKNEKENRMDNQWIEGYDDGYATTSPVGSFPANAYGLYDMSGNVWQWCEDWIDVTYKERVLRGAAWSYLDRINLLSSSRNRRAPNAHLSFIGFRCVLGASAP